jgi:hypothetical protein
MSGKRDLKRELDQYQAKRGEFRVLEVPPTRYLMADGHGGPDSADYADALAALFPMAYGLKFGSKRELGADYVVMPLEALWSADDPRVFATREKSAWDWTAMIMTPDWITRDLFDGVVEAIARKDAPASLGKVRLATLEEGLSVQVLHLGSFEAETPLLTELHERFLPEHGLAPTRRHHEIYLSDYRKVAPEKLRTIIRQPVVRL